jgi:hypothetical protein
MVFTGGMHLPECKKKLFLQAVCIFLSVKKIVFTGGMHFPECDKNGVYRRHASS